MNERELFENWHNSIYCEKLEFNNDTQEYVDTFDQSVWEAWRASTSREGYKLVPLEPSEGMIMAGCMEHGGYDAIDSKSIYKAMIGASE